MSADDAERWNARYADGAYAGRTRPSQLLLQWQRLPRVGRALDVACGAGRNALHLAGLGYQVDAVDVSSAALQRAASARMRCISTSTGCSTISIRRFRQGRPTISF